MTGEAQSAISTGWYGKLPVVGDFASRRLPPEFIEAWDQWLSQGLADWQASDAGWLDQYLNGPSWRFLVSPRVLGASAWAGVLMPSVDRVGRYFPLCIVQPRERLPDSAQEIQELLGWLARVDDLAHEAVQQDWTIELLDAQLAHLGDAPPDAVEPVEVTDPMALRIGELLSGGDLLHPTVWMARHESDSAALYVQSGMPARTLIPALLAGQIPPSSIPHEGAP